MKARVIDELKTAHGLSNADAERAYEQTVSSIKAVLKRDLDVRLSGIGTLKPYFREGGRPIRNPRTGETTTSVGKNTVKFKLSKDY